MQDKKIVFSGFPLTPNPLPPGERELKFLK